MRRGVVVIFLLALLALGLAPMLAQAHCNAAPAPLHCGGTPVPPSGFIAVQVGNNCIGVGGLPPTVINGPCPVH